jgi:hypothetical protein
MVFGHQYSVSGIEIEVGDDVSPVAFQDGEDAEHVARDTTQRLAEHLVPLRRHVDLVGDAVEGEVIVLFTLKCLIVGKTLHELNRRHDPETFVLMTLFEHGYLIDE